MASDESMTAVVSSIQDDEYDDIDVGLHPHNLSRFSMCTSSIYTNDDDDHDRMGMFNMSGLSIESFDADVDEDFSGKRLLELSSDSDQEPGCYSLPATPPRHRRNRNVLLSKAQLLMGVVKDYASENDAQKSGFVRPNGCSKNLRKRRVIKEMVTKSEEKKKDRDLMVNYSNYSGESEGGVVVITRPIGGKRSLCMDLEEMKACRDLGFELEMPGRDNTSSGGDSPIANWRISSPGDDPRDVKARLKVWAQAVALASTSRH